MGTLSLATYARLLAHLAYRRGESAEDVLADLGISAEDLARDEPALRRELCAAWPSRKGIGAMKFATALGTELKELGPFASDVSPDVSPPVAVDVETEKAVPSYLHAPSSAAVAPPPMPPPAEMPRAQASEISTETADIDLSAIMTRIARGPLPFAQQTAASRQQPVTAPPTGPDPGDASDEVDLERFPLEVYASVSGALAGGEARADALARHDLSAEVYEKLAKAWARRFEREPHLFAKFRELAQRNAKKGRGA